MLYIYIYISHAPLIESLINSVSPLGPALAFRLALAPKINDHTHEAVINTRKQAAFQKERLTSLCRGFLCYNGFCDHGLQMV